MSATARSLRSEKFGYSNFSQDGADFLPDRGPVFQHVGVWFSPSGNARTRSIVDAKVGSRIVGWIERSESLNKPSDGGWVRGFAMTQPRPRYTPCASPSS